MNDLKGIIEDCNKSDLVSDKVIKKIIEIIGQEEWQDLHDENNDICTTMGELIITLKGIADLESENAELKEKYKRLDNLEDFTFETYKTFKLDVKELARLFESRGYRLDGAYKENIKLQDQLTKAKDLIEDMYDKIPASHSEYYKDVESRAIFEGDRKMKDEEMAKEYEENHTHYEVAKREDGTDYAKKVCDVTIEQAFLAGLNAGRPQWHKLSEKYPEADKLVRVRLMSGMEHICETCYYEPTEDEIGYGKLIINFYELNGEWVDDNEIIAWCEIPTFDKE